MRWIDPRLKLYLQKWRWYERNVLPWNRARIHAHMLRAEAFIRFPVQGNVLESLDDGRLTIGANTVVTKDIPAGSIAAGAPARVIRPIDFAGEEPPPPAPVA